MKIKDICISITDGSHNPPQGIPESDYLMLSSKNIFDDCITTDEPRYLSKEDYERENKRTKIQPGDVLLTIVGTVGRTAVVPNNISPFTLQRSVAVLHPKTDICSSRFLMYALRSKRAYIEKTAKGVAQKGIYLGEVADIDLPVPSMKQQAEITEILDRTNDVIQKRQQQLLAFDALIKARFVEMFGDKNNPKYPAARLGDYSVLQGGFAFRSSDFVEEGIHLVQIGNVNKDYLNWETINNVPIKFLDQYSAYALKEGDLVMAMTRPIIKSQDAVKIAKVSKKDLPCLLNQRVGRFQIKASLHPTYLEVLCQSQEFKSYVERMSGNSLQPNISSKQVEDYMISIPPIELQNQFAAFVSQIEKSKSAVQSALAKDQLLFDSLMQKYFG